MIKNSMQDKYESDNEISFGINHMAEKQIVIENSYFETLKIAKHLKVGTSDYYYITIDVKFTYNCNETLVVSALGSDNAILAQSSFEIVTTFTDIALEAEAYVRMVFKSLLLLYQISHCMMQLQH